jgi:release factor glutamine methyltransferase
VTEVWTPLRLLEWTTRRFTDAAIDSPRLAAQILLAHALGIDRVQLYVQYDKPLGPDELGRYRDLVKRRLAGEPVAYLTGRQEFWSLALAVDARVLVPRRDTETLIEVVLDRAPRDEPLAIADIGTGSGAIALALARELPQARVVATDRSAEALAVARENAARLGLADRIELREGDLYGALGADERFDIVASNPPYVPSGDIAGLAPEVRREPRAALDGGADGLDLLRRLATGAAAHLTLPGGLVAFEHGFDQGPAVRGLLDATSAFEPAETRADMAGQPRVTWARILPRR